jgi:hypothetical protein
MTRDEFRDAVFARDGRLCVICKAPAADAHHVVERRCFGESGGYSLDNGASLCPEHHLAAERTILDCDTIREAAGIKTVVLPEHLYPDEKYDKWTNIIMPDGSRVRGELFYDESVQKVLKEGGMFHLFKPYVKPARLFHFPWSNPNSDDRVLPNLSGVEKQEVVASVKMDGEIVCCYRDHIHARSLEMLSGADRTVMKAIWATFAGDIPENWRVVGENIFRKHSIHYHNLSTYFMIHGIWNERNECLSWDETVEWAALLGRKTVPVLYRGPWDEVRIRSMFQPAFDGDEMEGYVVRVARRFNYSESRLVIGKFVKKNFNQMHGQRQQPIIKNELRAGVKILD